LRLFVERCGIDYAGLILVRSAVISDSLLGTNMHSGTKYQISKHISITESIFIIDEN